MERSLDQVREIIYNLPKYIPITRIPPANRAFYFHMLPVYLQINTWKHLRQLLEFDKFGFFTDENSNITGITTDKEHALKYMLQEIKCSCEKPNTLNGLINTGKFLRYLFLRMKDKKNCILRYLFLRIMVVSKRLRD